MSIVKKFMTSAAAVSITGALFATPTESFAQTRPYAPRNVQPPSCQRLDQEEHRMANLRQRDAQRLGRSAGDYLGSNSRNGLNRNYGRVIGDIAGSRAAQAEGNRYLNSLRAQCDSELRDLQEGVCVDDSRQSSSVRTRNGRVVGDAAGNYRQDQECQQIGRPQPQEDYLLRSGGRAPQSGAYGTNRTPDYDAEAQYRRDTNPRTGAPAAPASGESCRTINLEGAPALLCEGAQGNRVVPLGASAAPAPRR